MLRLVAANVDQRDGSDGDERHGRERRGSYCRVESKEERLKKPGVLLVSRLSLAKGRAFPVGNSGILKFCRRKHLTREYRKWRYPSK